MAAASTSLIRKLPASAASRKMPNTKGTSPSLVTRKAFSEAVRASAVSQWWPIRKYEQMPITSQPTSSTIRSPE